VLVNIIDRKKENLLARYEHPLVRPENVMKRCGAALHRPGDDEVRELALLAHL
jgi:hypothetical protein